MRLLALVVLVAGCSLYPGGGGDDDPCDLRAETQPGYLQELINPDTLACESFTTSTCDSTCGPCPGAAQYIPPWGACNSPCIALGEAACAASTECRAAYDVYGYYEGDRGDPFLGCYPLTQPPGDNEGICRGLDAEQCSRFPSCTALYEREPFCPGPSCHLKQFAECINEGQAAGRCDPATCLSLPPACPSNTTPGVLNGCWTGSCIPDGHCPA